MKKDIIKKAKAIFFIPNIVYVLAAAFIVRLLVSPFGTLQLDHGTFVAWSINLARGGLIKFYDSWSDYLPGYLYVLALLGKIRLAMPNFSEIILYKLPAILSDVGTGYLIYRILKEIKGIRWGLVGASLYLFNPAIFANSSLWGQIDSLTALFSLLSIYLFSVAYPLSALTLSLGTLIKPQVAIMAPVILFLMIKNKWSPGKIFIYFFLGLTIFVLGFLPFLGDRNLFHFIIERLATTLNQYPYTSINAFNFWGAIGFWQKDSFPILGYLIYVAIFVFSSIRLWKKENPQYLLAAISFLASFVFLTRMHERHLLPGLAPLAVAASLNSELLVPYFGLSATYLANLYYSFRWVSENFFQVFSDFFIKLFSLLNVGLLGLVLFPIKKLNELNANLAVQKFNFSKVYLGERQARLILIGILFFGFATRVWELGSPKSEYFDEVYHAFTAKVILHGDPKAWEWWNTPPSGFAYEWTHPPLAKLGMATGMKIFGENSFGWRVPGAVLGVGSVLLVYLIAKYISEDEVLALVASGVFSLDGLALVMSRIGMNDSYVLFFSLLTIYLFLKDKNFLAAFVYGLALSSKWSALWVIPILFVSHIVFKKKLKFSYLWFLLLPFSIYLLTYTPMFLAGHGLDIWWGMQKQMWWYHTRLRATHPYTSSWWTWPFAARPIYLYTSDEVGGWVSRIYAMGNPLVFWFGLASVVLSSIYSYLERNKKLAFVVFAYLIFFVPWAASPRIMFIYHYLPSVPFLAITTAYVLRRNLKLLFAYLFICLLVFVYFYPHWAGLSVPLWLDQSYYWFSSWR